MLAEANELGSDVRMKNERVGIPVERGVLPRMTLRLLRRNRSSMLSASSSSLLSHGWSGKRAAIADSREDPERKVWERRTAGDCE
jgi:hypothetical protein